MVHEYVWWLVHEQLCSGGVGATGLLEGREGVAGSLGGCREGVAGRGLQGGGCREGVAGRGLQGGGCRLFGRLRQGVAGRGLHARGEGKGLQSRREGAAERGLQACCEVVRLCEHMGHMSLRPVGRSGVDERRQPSRGQGRHRME